MGEQPQERGRGERAAMPPGSLDDATDEVLRALASAPRRAILRLVGHEELPAGAIAEAFEVTRTAVSQHLTVLKNAGLLTERRAGTRRLYQARPAGLAALREFLDDMWAPSLQAAARLVEADRGLVEDAVMENTFAADVREGDAAGGRPHATPRRARRREDRAG